MYINLILLKPSVFDPWQPFLEWSSIFGSAPIIPQKKWMSFPFPKSWPGHAVLNMHSEFGFLKCLVGPKTVTCFFRFCCNKKIQALFLFQLTLCSYFRKCILKPTYRN